MTKNAASKDVENREARFAEIKDFPDPSDSCDFGYTIVRAPQREESVGTRETFEYENHS